MLDMRGNGRVQEQAIDFDADGATLTGTLFLPEVDPVAAVVLNGAAGVPHAYYRHFARWLASERDMACLTYDYRDFGASAHMHPRHSNTTMSDWALLDQPAARMEMRRNAPNSPIWVIGHSLGAMMVPLQQGIEDVTRMIGVASGLVNLPDHPMPYRALASAFWYGPASWAVSLTGYLPGRRLGLGEDLPAGVYREWRDWCTSPRSFLPRTGHDLPWPNWSRSGAPVDLIAFADDPVIPARCTDRLAALYDIRLVRRRTLHPRDFGLKQIGHLSSFTRRNAVLWPELVR